MNRRPWVLGTVAVLVFLFLYAPIAWLAVASFNSSRSLSRISGFSLQWYAELADDTRVFSSLRLTLELALASAAISTVIGTLAAFGLRRAFPGRGLWTVLLSLPLVVPEVVLGVAMLGFFVKLAGIPLGFGALLCAHVAFSLSFVVVVVRSRVSGMDVRLEEAAADLGASPWQTFRRVTFQQVSPILIGASALVFMVSFDEFLMTNFVVGVDQTVPTLVFQRIRRTIDPTSNVISSLLLLVTVLISMAALVGALLAERRRGRSLDAVQGLG